MALSGRIALNIESTVTNPLDLSSPLDPLRYAISQVVSDGADANEASMHWHDSRQLLASGTDDIDLAGGITNAFGATITFARVKSILVRNKGTTAAAITVGPSPTNGVANFLGTNDRLPAGAWMAMGLFDATGWVITAGSADRIRVTNTSGSLTQEYEIIVIGSST